MTNYSTVTAVPHAKANDKSGTPQRRKSIICDGDFVNNLKADGFFLPIAPPVSHEVVSPLRLSPHPDSPIETLPFKLKRAARSFEHLLPISLPCTHPEVLFKPKRKPWRDCGEEIHGLFFHKALESEPSVKGFTLMLSRPVRSGSAGQGRASIARVGFISEWWRS